jgi:type VI secretion system protein ImpK
MVRVSGPNGLLLSGFRSFHSEVMRLREGVEKLPWIGKDPAEQEGRGAAPTDRVLSMQAELLALIQQLEVQARASGGVRAGMRMREAGYFMAALADEIFLTLSWDGREGWSQHLLEGRLYQSHSAGETVFTRAEQILAVGEDRELASVILCALALGFEGQYRGRGEPGLKILDDFKTRLLSFISGGGSVGSTGTDRLFPQAYQHTLETEPRTRLPRVATWVLIVLTLVGVQLLISHWVWVDLSATIREVTQEMEWLQGDISL